MDILITLLLITLPLLNITKLNHQYEYYHQEELVIILISGMVSGIVVSIFSLRINGDDGFNNYGVIIIIIVMDIMKGKVYVMKIMKIIIILIIIITTIRIRIITTVVANISLKDNNKLNPYIKIKNEIVIIIIH